MAIINSQYIDPNVEEEGEGFQVLPEGEYQAVITEDVYKANKQGTGNVLELTLQIIDGKHTGVRLKDYLNLEHRNEQAQRISQGRLRKICAVLGVSFPPPNNDTGVLFGRPLGIKVEVESFQSDRTGKELQSNRIKSYQKPKPQEAGPVKVDIPGPMEPNQWG